MAKLQHQALNDPPLSRRGFLIGMVGAGLAFGFTPAEAVFALEIIKGDGRQATADRLGITVGTARSHLSRIFDKTGVRHQAELVRLLLQK